MKKQSFIKTICFGLGLLLFTLTAIPASAVSISNAKSEKPCIYLSHSSFIMYPKTKITVEAQMVLPWGSKVKYSSSNKKVALVNQKGVVVAKKAGKAYITVKVVGTNTKARCKITVRKQTSLYNKYKQLVIGTWYCMGGDAMAKNTKTRYGAYPEGDPKGLTGYRYKVSKVKKKGKNVKVYITLTKSKKKYIYLFQNDYIDKVIHYTYSPKKKKYIRSEFVINKM